MLFQNVRNIWDLELLYCNLCKHIKNKQIGQMVNENNFISEIFLQDAYKKYSIKV